VRGAPRLRLLAGCAALFLLGAAGCRGVEGEGDPAVSVKIGISPTPPLVGPTRLLLEVERNGEPVQGARVAIEGNMSHAGMVPVLDSAREESPGRYGVEAFRFTMAGDWILEVRVELPDGGSALRRIPVRVSGGDPPGGVR